MDYTALASDTTIAKTAEALDTNHFHSIVVNTKEEAFEKIKSMIPAGASVMNGASVTLQQIGYVDYLKTGQHGWNNLHVGILAETDAAKQAELRKYSVVSDFYLGSVHAVTETGELFIASNSGSQMPHLAYTSPNLILVVGGQKIVPNLDEAIKRLNVRVLPLEDARMKEVYGYGTAHNKTLILHAENPAIGRNVTVIIVREALGF